MDALTNSRVGNRLHDLVDLGTSIAFGVGDPDRSGLISRHRAGEVGGFLGRWMMRQAGQSILGIATAMLLSGCIVGIDLDDDFDFDDDNDRIRGSGIVATTTRFVSGFDEVSISGVGRLLIEQGEVESLTITAEDNILSHINSEVDGGRLLLGPRDGVEFELIHEIVYRLTVRNLKAIDASGVTEVVARDLVSPTFIVNISGVSSVDLTGEADVLDVFTSGVSHFWGRDFFTLDTRVVASGVANVVVNVRDRLDVTASGASTIRYVGNPSVFADVSGASTVNHF